MQFLRPSTARAMQLEISVELAILGTGVSALLLAEALIRRGCFRRLRLIGPSAPARAHLLSYWSDVPTPFDAWAEASWSSLKVFSRHGQELPVRLSRFAYRTFRAQPWIDAALTRVLAAPGVEWIQETATSVTDEGDAATVEAGGHSVTADWVFASAPLSHEAPAAWQRFAGWEVKFSAGEMPTGAATLLDFRTPAGKDFRFLYALPLGPRRLFVEHVSYRATAHQPVIEHYLEQTLGLRDYEIVMREGGETPLYRTAPDRSGTRVIPIGVFGGVAKTTTGYAVTRMWRDAERIAADLSQLERPRQHRPAGALYRLADRFFLDQLAHAPERLPDLMEALFAGADGDAILAFLDECARPAEKLAVATAMPDWLGWWGRKRSWRVT